MAVATQLLFDDERHRNSSVTFLLLVRTYGLVLFGSGQLKKTSPLRKMQPYLPWSLFLKLQLLSLRMRR